MIDKHYIEAGIKIREEFIELNLSLTDHLDYVRSIGERLISISGDIIGMDLDGRSDDDIRDDVFGKITDAELEAEKINKLVGPINDRIESLRRDEESLYNIIREKYPNLSDNDIINEFKKYIKR